MKKILFSLLCLPFLSFSYTSSDVSNAEFLATQGIITTQASAQWYRLDDTITRAEAVGIALKLRGDALPEGYRCRKYYTDVTVNDWTCRAVELAADAWLVSRNNTKFRPKDKITRIEALSILIKSARLYERVTQSELPYTFDSTIGWQNELLRGVFGMQLLKVDDFYHTSKPGDGKILAEIVTIYFYPNRASTRAEIFDFSRKIFSQIYSNTCSECETYSDAFTADFGWNFSEKYDSLGGMKYSFGDKVEFYDLGKLVSEFPFSIKVEKTNSFPSRMAGEEMFIWLGQWNGHKYYKILYTGMCDGEQIVFPGKEFTVSIVQNCPGNDKDIQQSLKKINFNLVSYSPLLPTERDVLSIYYKQLQNSYIVSAYNMRSPAGVSLETFQSWYKNVTKVTFREDTMKNLWDNTYEFLIDMTENGVTSTYKVKSKVDLENFKINNISSVKQ